MTTRLIVDGATGDTYYRAASGLLVPVPIGADGDVLTVVAGLPEWGAPAETGPITAADLPDNIRDVGFGCQFGDGVNVVTAADLAALIRLPWAGTITEVRLDADLSCTATVNVRKNGTSIFTTLPALAGASTYDDTTLTGVTRAVAKGDAMRIVLEAVSGNPHRLTVILYVRKS